MPDIRLTTLVVLLVIACSAAMDGPPPANAPAAALTPSEVVESTLWQLSNSTFGAKPALERAFRFLKQGAVSSVDEFGTKLNHSFRDVLSHVDTSIEEVYRTDSTVCVKSDLTGPAGNVSSVSWCLEQQHEGACPDCWLIHTFERISGSPMPANGTVQSVTGAVESQSIPNGPPSDGVHTDFMERNHDEDGDKLTDDFKLGLGIGMGLLMTIAIVVAVLLVKLIRQGKHSTQDKNKLKLQHSSILYSPSRLTGDDWKVPMATSPFNFEFSPLGKTPSPIGGKAPSPESISSTCHTPSPLAKSTNLDSSPTPPTAPQSSPEASKAGTNPFPTSPWAV